MKRFSKWMLLVLGLGLLAVVLPPIPAHQTQASATPTPTVNAPVTLACTGRDVGENNTASCAFGPIPTIPQGLALQIDYISIQAQLSPLGSTPYQTSFDYQPAACETINGKTSCPGTTDVTIWPTLTLTGTSTDGTTDFYAWSAPVVLYLSAAPIIYITTNASVVDQLNATATGHYIAIPKDL
jgi:hypothetical protein